eukprot:scaffold13581_cov115-Isochrysis_galbana.AAC.1
MRRSARVRSVEKKYTSDLSVLDRLERRWRKLRAGWVSEEQPPVMESSLGNNGAGAHLPSLPWRCQF